MRLKVLGLQLLQRPRGERVPVSAQVNQRLSERLEASLGPDARRVAEAAARRSQP